MRTLIVEDDFTSRLLLQSFLSKYGECHLAVNGKEAVAAFRTAQQSGKEYDLICMDIMMPEMDGQTAVKEIRTMEKGGGSSPESGANLVMKDNTKIIMTTALDDVKNVVESFKSLCDAYLIKPIDTAKLLGHMRDFHLI
jgi:two-component system chemotaxis response regulator CheY